MTPVAESVAIAGAVAIAVALGVFYLVGIFRALRGHHCASCGDPEASFLNPGDEPLCDPCRSRARFAGGSIRGHAR